MRRYRSKRMEDLAADLSAGLARLKKGYVDSVESLIRVIDPQNEYPYEFVVYRLTGYRARPSEPEPPIPGELLRKDLLILMLDVCDSFALTPDAYTEPVYDVPSLSRRFNVSTKTLQRWCRAGLPARRFLHADGKRRLGFLESSVQGFVDSRRSQVARSMRFSQMTDAEKRELIERARRMARASGCSLSTLSKRLSQRTGRAVETIRYTIRRHDQEHPELAVFPDLAGPMREQDKQDVYQGFLRGSAVPSLAGQYHKTSGSIYRVINQMRAQHLQSRPIQYVYNPQFDLPNADDLILAGEDEPPSAKDASHMPAGLPPYLRELYSVPLLSPQAEGDLFRRYNYLKYKADRLRRQIDLKRVSTAGLSRIESLLLQATAVKNRIIRANLRLVVSIAKRHVSGGPQDLFELASDGNVSLMRAVEKFDYSRGNRFSTYASWAIIRNFARSVPRERCTLDHFVTGNDEALDVTGSLQNYDPDEVNVVELRESIEAVLAQLSPTERRIVTEHYGLVGDQPPRTFEQLGRYLSMSKERVRQIEAKAMRKLRSVMGPEQDSHLPA